MGPIEARSRPVAAIVVEDLKLRETPEELVDNLSVSIPLDTQLLEFSYTASTPEAAERLTQAFVDAHQKYQAQLLDGLVSSTRAVDGQIDLKGLQTLQAFFEAHERGDDRGSNGGDDRGELADRTDRCT